MNRRHAVSMLLGCLASPLFVGGRRRTWSAPLSEDFLTIEQRVGGRLGVAVLDVNSGRRVAYRADERFPMCSTFKWLLGAHILSRVDAREERLDRPVAYSERELLDYSPVTRAHAQQGTMSVAELVAAAIQSSDNAAANLLLQSVGGPVALTGYLRQVGDDVTRLDRIEPDLNSATPGDVRDTTTPGAMLMDMNALLLGERLSGASRDRLLCWLIGATTGAEKLRAGLPSTWRVGDKTGMGGHGSTNDVAIAWPAGGRPILIAAYLTETDANTAARNHALATVGRSVAEWLSKS